MNSSVFEKQLDAIIDEYKSFQAKSEHKDLSDLPKADRQGLVTKAIAAIQRISGPNSPYVNELNRVVSLHPQLHMHTSLIMGVVLALRDDIKQGYILTLAELVHGEVFADFLEMAQHLVDSKYKDAAAVICGSTLESHIRKLCSKNGIALEEVGKDRSLRPKKADLLNAELAKAQTYSLLDQKSVTAWLGLRNKAAHGNYGEYNVDQVALFISAVRDFIARNPA